QELFTADGRLAERQSGTLVLERPSRFRWHYSEPFEQLVVADGKNVWIYDVELEQVTVTPLDDSAASSPAMLLSGDQAVREGFTVVDEIADGELKSVLLEPELEGTDFRSVRIGFDGLTPRRLELVDGLGQVTVIELFDVKLNGEIDEKLFRFDPPRGVDGSSGGELKSVLLEPGLEGTDFRSVRIGFDGLTPRRLELVDGLGQVTVIELFDVKLNGEIDEKLFRFDPPRGVDVIGKPAR